MSKGENEISDSKEKITCPTCGDTFVAYKSRNRTYCSTDCQHQSLEGGFAGERFNTPTGEEHPRYVEREERECPVCDTEFAVRETSDQKACSEKCGKILHGWTMTGQETTIEERVCLLPTCENEFTCYVSNSKKYCCYECAMEDRKGETDSTAWTEYTCEQCGEVFKGYKNYERTFCSNRCRDNAHTGEDSPNWKGGWENYYGSTWTEKLKKTVRERDDRECQVCGKPESENRRKLEVHHITPFNEFGVENHEEANKPQNLVALCGDCHMKVECGKAEVQNNE